MTTTLTDAEISNLIQDTYNKIESKATGDTKVLSEMNNALNWILTMAAILFTFNNRNFPDLPDNDIMTTIISRCLFMIVIVDLIIHKWVLQSYEKNKLFISDSLRTHCLDIKYNIYKVKHRFEFTYPFATSSFINDFITGELYDDLNRREMVKEFANRQCKIKTQAKKLKLTYWLGLVLLFIFFILTIFTLNR